MDGMGSDKCLSVAFLTLICICLLCLFVCLFARDVAEEWVDGSGWA